MFFYMQVVIKFAAISVQPLYGPLAGGTRLTMRGQYFSLNVSAVRSVYFGQQPGVIDRHRSAMGFFLSCVSVPLQR